jgi:hypothetical protein
MRLNRQTFKGMARSRGQREGSDARASRTQLLDQVIAQEAGAAGNEHATISPKVRHGETS